MMSDRTCSNKSILEVWFSTTLSPEAYQSFQDACREILAKGQFDGTAPLPLVDKRVNRIVKWITSSPTPKEVQDKFAEEVYDTEYFILSCLKQKQDRLDYIDYIFSGAMFVDKTDERNVGNPTFMIPESNLQQVIKPRDSIFYHVDLKSFVNYETSLFATLEKYLLQKLVILRGLIQSKKLRLEFKYSFIGSSLEPYQLQTRDDELFASYIKNLNPAVIDWSSIPDAFNTNQFIDLMNDFGNNSTLHIFHSIKWSYYQEFNYFNLAQENRCYRNQLRLDEMLEFERKPYLEKFLIPGTLRYSPASLVMLCGSDCLKENCVRQMTNTFKPNSALQVERFGMENHWIMLAKYWMISFDLIMANKNLKQEQKDELISLHLKM